MPPWQTALIQQGLAEAYLGLGDLKRSMQTKCSSTAWRVPPCKHTPTHFSGFCLCIAPNSFGAVHTETFPPPNRYSPINLFGALPSMSYWRTFYHLIWATRQRKPLITPTIEQRLYPYLVHKAAQMEVGVLAIGGWTDHIHMVVSIPPKLAIAGLVKALKAPVPTISTVRVPHRHTLTPLCLAAGLRRSPSANATAPSPSTMSGAKKNTILSKPPSPASSAPTTKNTASRFPHRPTTPSSPPSTNHHKSIASTPIRSKTTPPSSQNAAIVPSPNSFHPSQNNTELIPSQPTKPVDEHKMFVNRSTHPRS